MGKLNGKVALVTGSGGGIGLAIAKAMLKEGARVCLNDVDEKKLNDSVTELRKEYGEAVNYVAGNVSNKKDAENIVEKTVEIYGKLSILVNNAGGGLNTPAFGVHFEDFSEDDYDLLVDVNLKGTFLVSQAAVRQMKLNNEGKIINTTTMSARTSNKITYSLSSVAYAAAKGGVSSFTRRLAFEVGQYGINVNAIAPGVIVSGERLKNLISGNPEVANTKEEVALGDFGEPNDIANAAVFLASEEARYITGAILDVNGGAFMG